LKWQPEGNLKAASLFKLVPVSLSVNRSKNVVLPPALGTSESFKINTGNFR
jgi:hypothetical protein